MENINNKEENKALSQDAVMSRFCAWDAYGNKCSFEKQKRAFNALMAYEKNCQIIEAKFFDPRMAKIPKGQRMADFAIKYGTTVEEMKKQWNEVERAMANGL